MLTITIIAINQVNLDLNHEFAISLGQVTKSLCQGQTQDNVENNTLRVQARGFCRFLFCLYKQGESL